jgi:antitoxin VapB
MSLSIRNPNTETLARRVAELSGESITAAILRALEERLERLEGTRLAPSLFDDVMAISKRCQALPTLDSRDPDDILGYNDHGAL